MTDYFWELAEDQELRPLADAVLVHNMEYGERKTATGIIIPDDNGKESGIRPRRCRVYAVGKNVDELSPGDLILVAHGRWTRGVKIVAEDGSSTVVRRVDPKDILLVIED